MKNKKENKLYKKKKDWEEEKEVKVVIEFGQREKNKEKKSSSSEMACKISPVRRRTKRTNEEDEEFSGL